MDAVGNFNIILCCRETNNVKWMWLCFRASLDVSACAILFVLGLLTLLRFLQWDPALTVASHRFLPYLNHILYRQYWCLCIFFFLSQAHTFYSTTDHFTRYTTFRIFSYHLFSPCSQFTHLPVDLSRCSHFLPDWFFSALCGHALWLIDVTVYLYNIWDFTWSIKTRQIDFKNVFATFRAGSRLDYQPGKIGNCMQGPKYSKYMVRWLVCHNSINFSCMFS